MTPEQFQQILDMVGAAGEGAFTLAVLWISASVLTDLAGWIAWFVTLVFVAKAARSISSMAFHGGGAAQDIAKMLGVNVSRFGYFDATDRQKLHRAVADLVLRTR